jgi:hypothetical protein
MAWGSSSAPSLSSAASSLSDLRFDVWFGHDGFIVLPRAACMAPAIARASTLHRLPRRELAPVAGIQPDVQSAASLGMLKRTR